VDDETDFRFLDFSRADSLGRHQPVPRRQRSPRFQTLALKLPRSLLLPLPAYFLQPPVGLFPSCACSTVFPHPAFLMHGLVKTIAKSDRLCFSENIFYPPSARRFLTGLASCSTMCPPTALRRVWLDRLSEDRPAVLGAFSRLLEDPVHPPRPGTGDSREAGYKHPAFFSEPQSGATVTTGAARPQRTDDLLGRRRPLVSTTGPTSQLGARGVPFSREPPFFR